ncbi:MAG: diguanylate cyclase [Candidatus Acidiferrales bacterium]
MKILVADDDAVSRQLAVRLLRKWSYDVVTAADGQAALEILRARDAPRLALLDWMMPLVDGPEVCRALRLEPLAAYVYVVLLTSKSDKRHVVEGLESGADDYLTKPFNSDELRARLRAGTRVLELEDNLVKAREVLRFKASHDALTGVWNRGAILELLQREVWRTAREGGSLAVLLADLDHFKIVNDTLGHLSGDDVLRETARRITQAVRAYDLVGRYGGEEFLILLPGCDRAAAEERAVRMASAVAGDPIETSTGQMRMTLSVGAISTVDAPGSDPTALLRAADAALYRAKERGRNRVEIAVPSDLKQPIHAGVG